MHTHMHTHTCGHTCAHTCMHAHAQTPWRFVILVCWQWSTLIAITQDDQLSQWNFCDNYNKHHFMPWSRMTGANRTVLTKTLQLPYDIHVVHPLRQPQGKYRQFVCQYVSNRRVEVYRVFIYKWFTSVEIMAYCEPRIWSTRSRSIKMWIF